VFYWAHFYLDTNLGALNTIVLIFSSLTAAWAVRNAQLGQTKLLKINIVLTIACAFTFMGVKYVEYSHKFHDGLLPMRYFEPKHEVWEVEAFKKKHPAAAEAMSRLMGKLEERKAVAALDSALPKREPVALTPVVDEKPGAAPELHGGEPSSAPRVNSPGADVASPRTQPGAAAGEDQPAPATGTTPGEGAAEGAPAPAAPAELPDAAQAVPLPSPVAPPAHATEEPPLQDDVFLANELRKLTAEEATPLLRAGVLQRRADGPFQLVRPEKAGVFFSIYFFMTGLHGIHVLVGIGIWIWMLVRAGRRKFGPKYFAPIDFSALYWHLVDLIWIYLFPLLYLIH
jgi:cytochrome c oxidase subunit 3